jgi:hypothetical protein
LRKDVNDYETNLRCRAYSDAAYEANATMRKTTDATSPPSRRQTKAARPSQKLLTLAQASLEYGPPYTSLRDLVLRGELPAVRLGGTNRFWLRRDDIERLIQRSVV